MFVVVVEGGEGDEREGVKGRNRQQQDCVLSAKRKEFLSRAILDKNER